MNRSKIKIIKKTAIFLATTAGILIISGIIAFVYYLGQIPDPMAIAARRVSESTKIYDRTGETVLYDVHGEEKRTIIPWEQMPDSIKKAVLASEDAEFYNHKGFDIMGILRAAYKDITSLSTSQGGSTITQQLIKKSLLGDEKTFSRKIKEVALSIQVERKFSKDQILWMYLNQIPFGSNTYGIESASQTYFNKHASELDLAESAILVAMIRAPSYYSPYGTHQTELIARRNYVLERMKTLGWTDQKNYDLAVKEVPDFQKIASNILAPHFVMMVKDYLENKYGADMIENGGLKVTTTLDLNLQQIATDTVLKYGKINTEKYKSANAAMVAADPKTGQILAMVGSKNYNGKSEPDGCMPGKSCVFEGNFNVATASRQPGSSFKPFAYSEFLSKGYPDSTILFDVKTEFNPQCDSSGNQETDPSGQKCYHPKNYDLITRGPVTVRQALAQSLNIPSVQVLYLAGVTQTIDLAHKLGITTLSDPTQLGLSLVLGGGEVRLVDMAAAYGTLANDGVRETQSFILKVTAPDGSILEEYKKDEERAVDPQVARLVTDILSDNNARAAEFGYNSSLYMSERPVAAKTGTTQENRDGWLIGYTPSLVTGVWTGNNNNASMTQQGAGVSAAGPMWHEFMTKALAGTQPEAFTKPDPVSSDKPMLNGSYTGSNGIHSILYYVNKNYPLGDIPLDPSGDSQFINWEAAVNRWINPGFNSN